MFDLLDHKGVSLGLPIYLIKHNLSVHHPKVKCLWISQSVVFYKCNEIIELTHFSKVEKILVILLSSRSGNKYMGGEDGERWLLEEEEGEEDKIGASSLWIPGD